jgi:hypothetical protein
VAQKLQHQFKATILVFFTKRKKIARQYMKKRVKVTQCNQPDRLMPKEERKSQIKS